MSGEYKILYYIDRSVLLENTPRVKFIRNYIRDPSGVFSISSLVAAKPGQQTISGCERDSLSFLCHKPEAFRFLGCL